MQLATEENKLRDLNDRIERTAIKLNDKQMQIDDLAINSE